MQDISPKNFAYYCEKFGVSPDTMRIALNRAGYVEFDRKRVPTPQEMAFILSRWGSNEKEAKLATPPPAPAKTATPKKKNPSSAFTNLNLYDVLVWAEAPLMISSLYASFDTGGLLIAFVLSVFLEKGRQIMRTPMMLVAGLTSEQLERAREYNDDLDKSKTFAFSMAAIVALFVLWGNGQFFHDHIAANRFALTVQTTYGYSHADIAARAFAILMTGISLAALQGLSLTSNHRQRNEK